MRILSIGLVRASYDSCNNAAHRHKRETGSLQGLAGCQNVTNEELLTLPCDILIPAALENQFRGDNARHVQARLIVELANGPTTPEADAVFHARKISVLPDILANAGGVTISYYEWVQNNENEQWDEDEVNGKLEQIMTRLPTKSSKNRPRSTAPWWARRLSGTAWVGAAIRWTLSIYGRPRSSWLLRGSRAWQSIEGSGRRR